LITSTRLTRNPKFVPIGPKGAAVKIREIYFLLLFFPRLAYWSDA